MVAYIPSPGRGVLHIGPLALRAYGLMIALGVIAAVWLAGKRWTAQGGDPQDMGSAAMWAVPGGIIGARIYHVITDWDRFRDDFIEVFYVWHGGLSIWGGVAGGTLSFIWWVKRRGHSISRLLDVVAPALPLAQAIGRWGNWFNQELFGKPTTVPWALKIDPEHRPAGYEDNATFHPTFLYEMIWNLLVVAMLLRLERRFKLSRGRLFALYAALYSFGRLWVELIRIDRARQVGGLRVNVWTCLVVMAVGFAYVAFRRPGDPPATSEPEPQPSQSPTSISDDLEHSSSETA